MSEIHDLTIDGRAVRVVMDHATACDLIRSAGREPPKIPAGCNTVTMLLRLADGLPALAINQTGWVPRASDDEQEVNGCMLIVLTDDACDTEIESAVALERIYHKLSEDK